MQFRQPPSARTVFGDVVILLFLLSQAADGVLTYIGVSTIGLHLEANPLLVALMTTFGQGAAVLGAKVMASGLGVSLHLFGVHRILAVLTGLYLMGAVIPWVGVLFGSQF